MYSSFYFTLKIILRNAENYFLNKKLKKPLNIYILVKRIVLKNK